LEEVPEMAIPFTGGCLCGAIRYECTAEPLLTPNCHCRDCQRISGSPFVTTAFVPKPAFRLTKGEPRYHTLRADSGSEVSRGFCAECGSALIATTSGYPDIVDVKILSFDDPSWCRPSIDMYTSSAQPWDYMDPALPKAAKMPPT
jgi:hypothetical protein